MLSSRSEFSSAEKSITTSLELMEQNSLPVGLINSFGNFLKTSSLIWLNFFKVMVPSINSPIGLRTSRATTHNFSIFS